MYIIIIQYNSIIVCKLENIIPTIYKITLILRVSNYTNLIHTRFTHDLKSLDHEESKKKKKNETGSVKPK